MADVIRKLLGLLSQRERRHAYFLFAMILVMAFLDVIGIASIMPFMAVLANPETVQSNELLYSAYSTFGFRSSEDFMFFLGLVVFGVLVISVCFKALTSWMIIQFIRMREYSISRRLVAGYLRQPYEWFLGRHSADLGKSVLSEVEMVVNGGVMPLMQLLAHGTVVVAILLLLVAIDPLLSVVVGVGMGGTYGVIYLGLRRMLDRVGKERVDVNEKRFKAISEAFGGIKEVKLGALEHNTLSRFDVPARRFARVRAIAQVASIIPRYLLEIITFGGMLVLLLYLMRSAEGLQGALPVIAVYALAGYRLMPALQVSYNNATMLRFSGPALDRLYQDIDELAAASQSESAKERSIVAKKLISLDRVTYCYPGANRPALEKLSLDVAAQTTIGLVGSTGSGKTTTVDIILGLLDPQQGALCVDGVAINSENRRAWQRTLGYVPQQIFLADETVAANIAFGVPKDRIDPQAVKRAARIANLHDFVVDEMPHGYDTLVGERGIRLSGGQRQRIGIARALYHEPTVLILDEATSALDNLTEQAVMDAVHNLAGEITIVLIAHRLTTVRECDRIYLLEHGVLAGEGTYDDLKNENAQFRSMAGV